MVQKGCASIAILGKDVKIRSVAPNGLQLSCARRKCAHSRNSFDDVEEKMEKRDEGTTFAFRKFHGH